MTDPRVIAALKSVGCHNSDPAATKKLLTAIANSGSAKANQHDVILKAAVDMIEHFEKFVVTLDYDGRAGGQS
jgi:hypothetical protein